MYIFEPKTIKIVWVSADQSWYNVVNSDESGEIKISTNEINDMDSIADPTKLVCGLTSNFYMSHRTTGIFQFFQDQNFCWF